MIHAAYQITLFSTLLLPFITIEICFAQRARLTLPVLFCASSIVIYAVCVGSTFAYDQYLHWDLDRFDLDGDGIFSGAEITPDQKRALERVVWDTGRNFMPILGGIYALGYSALVTVGFAVTRRFRRTAGKSARTRTLG